jgi:hypothetical protein
LQAVHVGFLDPEPAFLMMKVGFISFGIAVLSDRYWSSINLRQSRRLVCVLPLLPHRYIFNRLYIYCRMSITFFSHYLRVLWKEKNTFLYKMVLPHNANYLINVLNLFKDRLISCR